MSDPTSSRPDSHATASAAEYRAARLELLAREKELTRRRDEVSALRRELPWVPVTKDYVFESADGPVSLAGLFGEQSQLILYHFMFGPDWAEGCPVCSFWAENFGGNAVHRASRDTAFACVSRAPLAAIEAYRQRMGWSFRWVSSAGTNFNFHFGVL